MPFSERCSLLYFAFSDIHRENHMYNFNVGLILDLFRQVFVAEKNVSTDPTARLQVSLSYTFFAKLAPLWLYLKILSIQANLYSIGAFHIQSSFPCNLQTR
jgi:hypothetical protein